MLTVSVGPQFDKCMGISESQAAQPATHDCVLELEVLPGGLVPHNCFQVPCTMALNWMTPLSAILHVSPGLMLCSNDLN